MPQERGKSWWRFRVMRWLAGARLFGSSLSQIFDQATGSRSRLMPTLNQRGDATAHISGVTIFFQTEKLWVV